MCYNKVLRSTLQLGKGFRMTDSDTTPKETLVRYEDLPPIEGGILLPHEWLSKTKGFKPSAYIFGPMDMLDVVTKDCSYRNHWLGGIHLEFSYDSYKNRLVGFHVVSINYLTKTRRKTSSIFCLLTRAFFSDWDNRAKWGKVTKKTFLYAYTRVFFFTLIHPRIWRVYKEIP